MKKNKGFTLMELLAVIVVLVVIALIAVPLVLKLVNKAKEGAAEASAHTYVKEVENYIVLSQMDSNKTKLEPGVVYQLSDIAYEVESELEQVHINDLVNIKGSKPLTGYLIMGDQNKIQEMEMIIDGYHIEYKDNESNSIGKYDQNVNSVTITDKTISTIQVKEQLKIPVETDPKGANVIWKSSDEKIATVDQNGVVTAIAEGNVTITVIGGLKKDSIELSVVDINDSILGYVSANNFINDEVRTIIANNQSYSAHVYTFNGDQNWTSNMTFGTESDVATATTNAKNMVIVKVNGNLTINEGVTVTTYSNEYGGPKGFLLYVTGTLTNNGTITMTGKGAKAPGENVYLWKNDDASGSYEYVPAAGGLGSQASTTESPGVKGIDGSLRQTGGGGSGGSYLISSSYFGGAGTAGTSYSGGSGGGGNEASIDGRTTMNALSNGGAGGIGGANNSSAIENGGGGAGNPGGIGCAGANSYEQPRADCSTRGWMKYSTNGSNGTGGLLIIYADTLINTSTISANGLTGGNGRVGGGSSGGGSINIFYNTYYNNNEGNIEYSGGAAVGTDTKGGAGGNGTLTEGSIKTGIFTKLVKPATPIINTEFLKLTSQGIFNNTITYDSRNIIDNYYSIDGGITWIPYTKGFNLTSGKIIAKSVVRDTGVTVYAEANATLKYTALPSKAYDGIETSYVTTSDFGLTQNYNAIGVGYLYIDPSMYGKTISVLWQRPASSYYHDAHFNVYNHENKAFDYAEGTWGKTVTTTYTIPSTAKYIEFRIGSSAKLYEIYYN